MAAFRTFTSSGIYTGLTDKPTPAALNNTDVTAPKVRLYIEGVEVPFSAISINQAYGRLPSADIQIPPESGLLDIIRGYEPKVHIFYYDENYGGDRLLFWGMITSSNYSRSRSGQGSTNISFQCQHKNMLLEQITMDFFGWASRQNPSKIDPQSSQAIFKGNNFNSTQMVIQAFSGITGIASASEVISRAHPNVLSAPIDKLDPSLAKFEKRLQGMPAVIVNLWNQMKIACYNNTALNISMETMYIPLLEEALSYFKRMSGHYFIETQVQSGKQPYCHNVNGKEINVMTPHTVRLPILSADAQRLGMKSIHSSVGFSGELTTFSNMIQTFLSALLYEYITLASPAEVNIDPEVFVENFTDKGVEKTTIETVVKPQLPFYYSPICNVLLPRMYSSISLNQEEGGIPSRVTGTYDALTPAGGSSGLNLNYRAPASVREAVAFNAALNGDTVSDLDNLSLRSTTSYSYAIPGRYEQGRGIKPETTAFPWWLGTFANNKEGISSVLNQESVPRKGDVDYESMMMMTVEWRERNGILLMEDDARLVRTDSPRKYKLNPYDPANTDIRPHERLFFATVDYEYTKRIAGSRSGIIEAVFNPYIIPGYPMDVIDESPNHPSFHGLCTSVTHSITSRSITTSVSIAAATTYAELSNYYLPPSPPFLSTALGLINAEIDATTNARDGAEPYKNVKATLLQNPKAKLSADAFYKQVLGVGAAAPEDLMHFTSGHAFPVDRKAGVFLSRAVGGVPDTRGEKLLDSRGGNLVDYFSTVGNLRLVSRPIESKASISSKFGYTFIDLDKNLYNNTYVNYRNPILASNFYLEPGASLFLDYMETEDFIKAARARTPKLF